MMKVASFSAFRAPTIEWAIERHGRAARADSATDATMAQSGAQEKIAASDIIDIYWQYPKAKKLRDGTAQSMMPVILRNLAPESGFDPVDVWVGEKRREAAAEEEERAEAKAREDAASGKKKKKTSKGQAKSTKRDDIRKQQEAKKEQEEIERDMTKLDNSDRRSRMDVKMDTKHGHFRQMLEVLKDIVDDQEFETASPEKKAAAFDVLWAIEGHALYQAACAEEQAAEGDEAADGKEKKKKKKKTEEKDKKSKKDKKGSSAPRSREGQLKHEFRKHLKTAMKWRKYQDDITSFQLNHMADRLPPLSKFSRGWRLDAWQKRVLDLIERGQSAIVCAPTSSGKTIISTLTALREQVFRDLDTLGLKRNSVEETENERILFVVPTEPLVWQVASMFQKLLGGKTAMCTNLLQYRPEGPVTKVVVGTPMALESRLTKVRGKAGFELKMSRNRNFFGQLDPGLDFRWAIFDEVHSLDGEEGAALQRLIRALSGTDRSNRGWTENLEGNAYPKCSVLALSATIGNAEELREWWSTIHGANPEVVVVEDDEIGPRPLDLEVHSSRFINLQRYVWQGRQLKPLHPCASIGMEQLEADGGLSGISLAFTPRDSHALWAALQRHFVGDKAALVQDLEPTAFFSQFGSNRVTLDHAKSYEEALKDRLRTLAREDRAATAAVLDSFKAGTQDISTDVDVWSVAKELRRNGLIPALVFNLNTFKCLEIFNELLARIEQAEVDEQPDYRAELQRKADELERKAKEDAKAAARNAKEFEEEQKAGGAEGGTFIDVDAPHKDYVLFLNSKQSVSSAEFDDIKREVQEDRLQDGHPWLRALRRGIGIYIDDACFPAYRRVVQRLAQRGKLGIVFSDNSLAYGVNMPFRTCVFFGDMGNLLNPLMAQQMSGRAGRRGMDTQGNLAYINMPWDTIRSLMLGRVPAIRGEDPLYPLAALQMPLNIENYTIFGDRRFNMLSDQTCSDISDQTFEEFCLAKAGDGAATGERESYYETSKRIMLELGYLTTGENPFRTEERALREDRRMQRERLKKNGRAIPESLMDDPDAPFAEPESMLRLSIGSATMDPKKKTLYACLWELRDLTPGALALEYVAEFLLEKFSTQDVTNASKAVQERFASDESRQVEFMVLLLSIFDRTVVDTELFTYEGSDVPLQEHPWLSRKESRRELISSFMEMLEGSQDRLIGLPDQARLQFEKPASTPLDSSVFFVIMKNTFKAIPDLSSLAKYSIKTRLFRFGTILSVIHNQLARDEPYLSIAPILRKCFNRIRYILRDSVIEEARGGANLGDLVGDPFQDSGMPEEEGGDYAATNGAAGGAEEGKVEPVPTPAAAPAPTAAAAPAPAPAPAAEPAPAPAAEPAAEGGAPATSALPLKKKKGKKKKLPIGGFK